MTPEPSSIARPADGVVFEDGSWSAYLNGAMVAAGPTFAVVKAAYEYHRSADEYRSGPDDE